MVCRQSKETSMWDVESRLRGPRCLASLPVAWRQYYYSVHSVLCGWPIREQYGPRLFARQSFLTTTNLIFGGNEKRSEMRCEPCMRLRVWLSQRLGLVDIVVCLSMGHVCWMGCVQGMRSVCAAMNLYPQKGRSRKRAVGKKRIIMPDPLPGFQV